jgi:hypothetical protein
MRRSFLLAPSLAVLHVALLVKSAAGQGAVIASVSGDAMELATFILNPAVSGVQITKAVLLGNPAQHGIYAQLGLFKGLPTTGTVLSSGKVEEVKFLGVKQFPSSGFDNSLGDADLDTLFKSVNPLLPFLSTDAAVLSVEVKVVRPVTITVAYVFGSVDNFSPGTNFPDVFGLFLNKKNLALIGGRPVSVGSLYCFFDGLGNCNQLIKNFGQVGTSLPTYTVTQQATLDLPTGTHQIKVAVADGTSDSNRLFDAAAFVAFVGAVKAPTAAPVFAPVPVPVPVPVPGKMMKMMMMTRG